MSKIPVTVVVPVKNEEMNLARCLAMLASFEEVIVVDSSSIDGTVRIASDYRATVLNFVWDGKFPKKRNWVLMSYAFKTEWVLFLDADELVSREFCDAVARVVNNSEYHGYWLRYTNYFLGHRLAYGVEQRKLALFRVGSGLYERIDESNWSGLDMEVHEHPVIGKAVGEIVVPIEHNDFRGIDKFMRRHFEYAQWEAHRLLELRNSPESQDHLSPRQKFKYRHIEKWWYPWVYFFYSYLFKRGFLDGRVGFLYAFYKSWYFLTIAILAGEFRAASKIKDPVPQSP